MRANTGIQRAVRSIIAVGTRLEDGAVECVPIEFDGNRFVRLEGDELPGPIASGETTVPLRERLRRWFIRGSRVRALRLSLLHPRIQGLARQAAAAFYWMLRRFRGASASTQAELEYSRADWIVLLDSTWGPDLRPELARAKAQGARVCVVIYDLIQIRHPDLVSPGAAAIFRRWFERTLPLADRILTISKAVHDDVRRYLHENAIRGPAAEHIGWFHLGSDFDRGNGNGSSSTELLADFADGFPPSFLVVGTLERRKSQATVLDVFEWLWESGDRSRLILVGHEGWGSHALTSRLRRHRELGRRLLWVQHASDADLELCYRNATALIIASTNEGFGLPIVEALHRGVPVIATDIPVFREVGGDDVTFVPPGDADALAKAIGMAERGQLKRPAQGRRRAQSWAESTAALIAQLIGHDQ